MTTVLSEIPYRIPNQRVGHVGRAIQNAHNAKEMESKFPWGRGRIPAALAFGYLVSRIEKDGES